MPKLLVRFRPRPWAPWGEWHPASIDDLVQADYEEVTWGKAAMCIEVKPKDEINKPGN